MTFCVGWHLWDLVPDEAMEPSFVQSKLFRDFLLAWGGGRKPGADRALSAEPVVGSVPRRLARDLS